MNYNYYYKLLLFLCIVVLYACSAPKPGHTVDTKDLQIISIEDPGNHDQVRLSELVKRVHIVPLQAGQESLVGEIRRMCIYKDVIYIRDKYREDVLLSFDMQGNFIQSIGRLGKGDGEYLELTGFDVAGDRITIYDRRTKRIFYYDLDGKLVDVRNIGKERAGRFAYQKDWIYLYNSSANTTSDHELNIYDAEGKLHAQYFPVDPGNLNVSTNASLSNVATDGSIPFYIPLNDTIYTLSADSLKAAFFIDFKKHAISKEDKAILKSDFGQVDQLYQEKDYVSGIDHVLINEKFVFFTYGYRMIQHPTFYNRKTKKIVNTYDILDDISFLYFSDPITQYNGQWVGALYPENFEGNIKMIDKMRDRGMSMTAQGKETLQILQARSKDVFSQNALLIFYEWE